MKKTISEEERDYFYWHREEGHPEYGPALRCPACGGTEFFLYRGSLSLNRNDKKQ
jgi:hypothetical protein